MTDLRKMATEFAKEMIEHNLKNGAQTLDKEYIADDACELAYLIDKKIKAYGDDSDDDLSEKKFKKMIKEAVKESRQEVFMHNGAGVASGSLSQSAHNAQ